MTTDTNGRPSYIFWTQVDPNRKEKSPLLLSIKLEFNNILLNFIKHSISLRVDKSQQL